MTENNPNKFLNVCAGIFLTFFILYLLKELQSIVLPFFIAVVISFVFLPLYNILLKKKLPAALAIITIVLIILIVSNLSSVLIITSINSFSQEFPKYEMKFLQVYEKITSGLNIPESQLSKLSATLNFRNMLLEGKLTSAITGIFSSITSIMGNYILILFYVIFLLSEAKSIENRLTLAYPDKDRSSFKQTLTDIITGVKSYIAGKTLLSLIQAVIIGIILWAFGVDFYFIWGFMFFFSDFIPNIGSLVVTVLIAVLMLLQYDNIVTPVIIIIILILIQNLKGNILEPKIFGARLDLSPLMLLLSLIFWGYIWGIVGMILSVPIMSMIKIILMNFPGTKPLAILMSNNPTPNSNSNNNN